MLAHSSELAPERAAPSSGADMLTQVLLGLRLDGVEYGRCLMHAPWAIAFPATREARFHFVAQGECWLRTPSSDWLRLNPGDAVLLPRGSFHILASAPDLPAVDIDTLARVQVSENIYLMRGDGCDDASAPHNVMFCGAMRFNLDPLHRCWR